MRKLIILLLLLSSVAYGQRGAVPLRTTTTPFGQVYGPDWLFKVGDSLYGTSAKTSVTGTIADMVAAGTAVLIGPGGSTIVADTTVSDTTGVDPLCTGLTIYSLADNLKWQHAPVIDTITGDTTGCEWIDISKAQWLNNGNNLYYDSGNVLINKSLYTSLIYPKPGTAAINLRAAGLDPGTEDLAAIQIWGSAGGYINSYAKREWSGDLFQALQRLDPFSTYQSFSKNGVTKVKISTDTNALYPEIGKVDLGKSEYPWNDGYSKNFHFNDSIFLKGRLGTGYIKLWNDRYLRLACDATSFYLPNIPAASKPMVLNYDTETGLIGYSAPAGFTFANGVTDSTSVLYWVGDSMLRGGNCSQPPTSDSVVLPRINGCQIADSNISVGGREIRTADSLFGTFLVNNFHPRAVNILVVWLGINDLKTRTAGATFASLESFCVKFKTLGYRIVVATLPSSNVGDALRNEYNRLIRLNYTRFADRIADIGAESHIGVDGSYSNTSLFCDGLHLTILGNDYAAAVLQTAINDLVLNQRVKYAANINADTVNAVIPGYQPTLVSGGNIKTINGSSVLGSGDMTVSGTSQWTTSGSDIYYNTGAVGAGTTSPQAAFHLNRHTEGLIFAFSNTRVNKNQSTQTELIDTASFYMYLFPSGKTQWVIKNSLGANRLWQDTLNRLNIYDTVVAKYERIDAGTSKVFRSYGTGGLLVQNATSAPSIGGERSNGTATVPTAVVTNDILFAVNGRGYGTSFNNRTQMAFVASENWTGSANGSDILWKTTANGGISMLEKMRLTNGGNVGIGTSTPSTILHVNGVVTATGGTSTNWNTAYGWGNHAGHYESLVDPVPAVAGNYYYKHDGAGTKSWAAFPATPWLLNGTAAYYNSGNVGIGTSAPTQMLSFNGNISNTILSERNTVSNTAGNSLTLQAGGATASSTDKAGGDLILSSGVSVGAAGSKILFKVPQYAGGGSAGDHDPLTAMTLTSYPSVNSAVVGIGTTFPLHKLSIVGDANLYTLQLDNSSSDGTANPWYISPTGSGWGSGDNRLIFNYATTTSASSKFTIVGTTGRIGVGTVNPSSLFHVNGTSRLGNSRADSTKINGLLYLPNIDKDTCANDYDLRWKASTGKATAYPRTKNTGDITAGTGITTSMMAGDMRYNGSSAIDITADPQIADGLDGQEISIVGLSDTNTLTLDDGTGLALAGNATMVLGVGDVIRLRYILSLDLWIEISRSNN